MTHWIWSHKNWPQFTWNAQELSLHLSRARLAQGRLLGIIQTIHTEVSEQVDAIVLGEQAMDTSAIEGERLNRDSVRSSITNRLGLEKAGISASSDRYIEGLLDMLLDVTQNHQTPLTLERLYGWHAALFPTGYSGMHKVAVGSLRQPGPMQIVSGRPGREKVHYEAPPAEGVEQELRSFLVWFNEGKETDGLLRAGISHLWFELLHPFEDGNGRVGRAIIDLALSQDEQLGSRYYSLSSAIMKDRKKYYASLEKTCRGDLDITPWLIWFLGCFEDSIHGAIELIDGISCKSRFWERHATTEINTRQMKVLNRLLNAGKDGFVGHMTTRKYMQLTKTSRATAYRELSDLVNKSCLKPTADKGRSAAYEVDWSL
jgi:Fic family protein